MASRVAYQWLWPPALDPPLRPYTAPRLRGISGRETFFCAGGLGATDRTPSDSSLAAYLYRAINCTEEALEAIQILCHLPAPWPNRGADQNVEYLQDRNHPFSLGNVFSEIPVEIPWRQRSGTGMCGQCK